MADRSRFKIYFIFTVEVFLVFKIPIPIQIQKIIPLNYKYLIDVADLLSPH